MEEKKIRNPDDYHKHKLNKQYFCLPLGVDYPVNLYTLNKICKAPGLVSRCPERENLIPHFFVQIGQRFKNYVIELLSLLFLILFAVLEAAPASIRGLSIRQSVLRSIKRFFFSTKFEARITTKTLTDRIDK